MSILDTVRAAYVAGLCLLPVREDGTKQPDVSAWKLFQAVRPTVVQMRRFDFGTRCGIGMIAGAVSGYRECWDFDTAQVFDDFLEAAERCGVGNVVSRIRAGYEDQTPGGGRRWIVQYPNTLTWGDCTLARRPGREGEPNVKTLIELPTYAILAPSHGGVHPSGRPYVRVTGDFTTIAIYTTDERDALFDLARSFDQMPRRDAVPTKTRTAHDAGNLKPGEDYNRRATWRDLLEPAGWTPLYQHGDVTAWRRPGKDVGLSATTNYGGSDLLWVFSSSTEFDPERSYSKFGAFATLHHRGDFSKAALALSKQGYGEQARPERPTREGTRRREATGASTTPDTAATSAGAASWRWLSDVRRENPDWLWHSRLARGSITLLIGDGGLGKSRATHDMAARITTGGVWPDMGAAPLGRVVILSAEDSPSYTLRPSLEAAGGDLSRVAILDAITDGDGHERVFRLDRDLAALDTLIEQTEALVVIVDPLSAYFGTTLDSYRDSDVRSVLAPLVSLAERRRVAVLGVMHIGKASDRHARHRALGSVAFVNTARLVFAVGADPDDPGRRLMAPVKANICREAPTLAFRLVDVDGTARVEWDTAPVVDMSADVVLNGRPTGQDDERQDADGLLRQLLEEEHWPLPASAIEAAGRAHGIHVRSLQRAARRLSIRIAKATFRGGWMWYPPNNTDEGDTCRLGAPHDANTQSQITGAPRQEDDTTAAPEPLDDDARRRQVSSSKTTRSVVGHEDDTSPKTTRRRQCMGVSSSDNASSSQSGPAHEGDTSSSVVFVDSQQKGSMREDDTSGSSRASEELPAWVLADDGPPPAPGSADAALAAHDEDADAVDRL